MAQNLRPWIRNYLTNIGEDYGARLHNAPMHVKPKQVQIVEYLTYMERPEDDCLWAKLSDSCHMIPVRFTKEALKDYENSYCQDSQGQKLQAQRNAIVKIKSFRAICRRIPVGNNAQRMTKLEVLSLDVDCVELVGPPSSSAFGSPQDIDADEAIRAWTEDLRKSDGGDILKLRKEQHSKAEPTSVEEPFVTKNIVQQNLQDLVNPPNLIGVSGERVKTTTKLKDEWRRGWQPYLVDPGKYVKKPWDEPELGLSPSPSREGNDSPDIPNESQHAQAADTKPVPRPRKGVLDFSSLPGSPTTKSPSLYNAVPTTPTEWSETSPSRSRLGLHSPEGSPSLGLLQSPPQLPSQSHSENKRQILFRPNLETVALPEAPTAREPPLPTATTTLASSLSAPTPAQRQRPPTLSSLSFPSSALVGSSPNRPPPSAFSVPPNQRKVPLPQVPLCTHAAARGLILVPNSDTSGSASQPPTQPQPMSQEQSQSRPLLVDSAKASPIKPTSLDVSSLALPSHPLSTSGSPERDRRMETLSTMNHGTAQIGLGDDVFSSQHSQTGHLAESHLQTWPPRKIRQGGVQPMRFGPDDAITLDKLKKPVIAEDARSLQGPSQQKLAETSSSLTAATHGSSQNSQYQQAFVQQGVRGITDVRPSDSPSVVEETLTVSQRPPQSNDTSGVIQPSAPAVNSKRRLYASAVPSPENQRPSVKKVKISEEQPSISPSIVMKRNVQISDNTTTSYNLKTSRKGMSSLADRATGTSRGRNDQHTRHGGHSGAQYRAHDQASAGDARQAQAAKLGGVNVDFRLKPDQAVAPLLTWQDIVDIIRCTEQLRKDRRTDT